jgi:hypothetical protein
MNHFLKKPHYGAKLPLSGIINHLFNHPTMSTLLFDSDSRPQWLDPTDNHHGGFLPGSISPFIPFKGLCNAAAAEEHPRVTQLGPRGPVPTIDSDTAVSLLGILPASLAGTPMGTPKSTPVASPNWGQGFFGPMSPEPLHLTPSCSRAAFLPPEFYLDRVLPSPDLAQQTPPSSASLEASYEASHKRGRSPLTEQGHFLNASSFSLPHRAQPYIECNASEIAIQALGLLEEEIIQKLGVISI